MQTLSFPSSENATSYSIAGLGDRILAFIIDGLILGFYSPIIVWLLLDADVDDVWVWSIFFIVPLFFYTLVFEILQKGQTPGKRFVNIRVVREDGGRPSMGQYVVRWFFTIIGFYFISGVIAMIVISANGKGQCFGDIVAGTRIIKDLPPGNFYQPVFPAARRLEAYDIELIKRALYAHQQLDNAQPLTLVSDKLKSMLGIHTELSHTEFLTTLVKDFNHLSAR